MELIRDEETTDCHFGLCVYRQRQMCIRDRWCIPCGHVEWDESIETAAVREFEEETGLQVELESLFAVKSNFHDREHQTVGIWFRGRQISGKLQSGGDLSDAKFYSFDDLPELAFPTDRQVIDELQG